MRSFVSVAGEASPSSAPRFRRRSNRYRKLRSRVSSFHASPTAMAKPIGPRWSPALGGRFGRGAWPSSRAFATGATAFPGCSGGSASRSSKRATSPATASPATERAIVVRRHEGE